MSSVEDQYKLGSKTVEHIERNGRLCERQLLFSAGFVLTDVYQDGNIVDLRLMKNVKLAYKNTHASNGLKYRILVCIDPVDWRVLKDETVLAANTPDDDSVPASEAWCFLKMQAKNAVAGQMASISGFACEKS
jgi:hypothetical protein